MTLQYFFSSKYLFDPSPSRETSMYLYLLIFFGVILLFGILVSLIKSWDQKIRSKQFYCFLTCGILGFVYLFARYEQLPWLGSRLFLVLIILGLLGWIVGLVIWMFEYSKKLKQKEVLEKRYEKYLPKKRQMK